MEWIERIENRDGALLPVYVDGNGVRTLRVLGEARRRSMRAGYKVADVEGVSLPSLKREDASRFLAVVGHEHVDPTGHDVFTLEHDGSHYLIPTSVLLKGLIGRLSSVGDRLLEGASLPRVAVPVVEDGTLRIRFMRKLRMGAEDVNLDSVQSRYIWLTCYPSARRMWGSVYSHAADGSLSATMPLARIDASFVGRRLGDLVMVTRMTVKALYPDERPLPFAAPFVAPPFKLATDNGGSDRLQAYWRSATRNASITKESDLPIGEAGYATTPLEWDAVLQALATLGYSVQRRSKANVDMALEKYGAGRTWSSFGDDVRVQRVTHQRWVKDGKWDAMKSVLKTLRAGHGGQATHPRRTD